MKRFSSHDLARELLRRPEQAVRAFTPGRIVIAWDGKPSDLPERITTEELFGKRREGQNNE